MNFLSKFASCYEAYILKLGILNLLDEGTF